jgi:hypothetical protein
MVVPIPGSKTAARVLENMGALAVTLSQEEVAALEAMGACRARSRVRAIARARARDCARAHSPDRERTAAPASLTALLPTQTSRSRASGTRTR